MFSSILGYIASSISSTSKQEMVPLPKKPRELYSFIAFKIEEIPPHVNFENNEDKVPLPRSGHRMVCIDSNLYVFGGYNCYITKKDYDDKYYQNTCPLFQELWKFNILNCHWTRLPNNDKMPTQLVSHSAISCGQHMIIYGGTGMPFGEASSNLVHTCYLPKGQWHTLKTEGSLPVPMYGQAACRHKNKFYVCGGTTGYNYSMDMHLLDLDTAKWTYLPPDSFISPASCLPNPRYRHEIVYRSGLLYVFGGGQNDRSFRLGCIHTFDPDRRVWSLTKTERDPILKEYPKERKCHVVLQYGDYVYVQGGTKNSTINYFDLWRLDMTTWTWQKLATCTPKPVYFHSGSITETGTIYLFGGIWEKEKKRSNRIFRVDVAIPPLRELAWRAVTFYSPHIAQMEPDALLRAGVPPQIVNKLVDYSSSLSCSDAG